MLRRRRDQPPPAPAAAAGGQVTVWIRGLGRTAGTVAATTDRSATITLVVDPRFGDETISSADAVVEHTERRGLYRQEGTVGFEAGGDVSFAPSGQPSRIQRRDFVRVPVEITGSVTPAGGDDQLELQIIDVSASGVLLGEALAVGLDEGRTVWLSIPLDDGMPPIGPRGAVVRDGPAGARGVHFDYIAESDQERLVRFVMREELRLRRQGLL